jgi:hypothetical protein
MLINKIKEKITRRRKQILVHSCIYYRLNSNLISDHTYDEWAYELVKLQNKYPNLSSRCPHHKAFKDFSGDTGYHLPIGDNEVVNIALRLLEYSKKRSKGE